MFFFRDAIAPIAGIPLTAFSSLAVVLGNVTIQESSSRMEAYRNYFLMKASGGPGSGNDHLLDNQYLMYADTPGQHKMY